MSLKCIKATVLFVALILTACRKDRPKEQPEPVPVITKSTGVYIVNEGTFNFSTAKVSYYNIVHSVVTEDLFKPANNRALGDVAQSICFFNHKAYIVVNNSSKIEVVDPATFIATATITGLMSPRYLLPVNNNKAYVTDFLSNGIAVLDLNSNTIVKNIPCKGWTEELAMAAGKVFITNYKANKLYVVNPLTDVIADSITVTYACSAIRKDKNGALWVLSSGNKTNGVYPQLFKINPVDHKVERAIVFPNIDDEPKKLNINGKLDALYYLAKNGVYKLSVDDTVLPAIPLIQRGSYNFYGIGIDPATETVYVADAIDYVQKGVVLRYQPNGTFINSFYAGIIPSEFYFN